MISGALIACVISAGLLLLFWLLTIIENRRGSRLVLSRLRLRLDSLVDDVAMATTQGFRYVGRRLISLSWYYSLHAFFVVLLRFISSLYHRVESLLILNRARARAIRRELRESHLTKLTTHQEATKLTPAQAKKLKDKALKGL